MDGSVVTDTSTVEPVVGNRVARWRHWARNGVYAAFVAFVAIGAAGSFDLTHESASRAGGVTITVQSPLTTRAGADIQLIVTVEDAEVLPEVVALEIDREYLEMFEDLDFTPAPTTEHAGLTTVRMEFAVQPGQKNVVISAEGRAADAWEPRTGGTVALVEGERRTQEVALQTWRLP